VGAEAGTGVGARLIEDDNIADTTAENIDI
jgi:hypothetical protein